MSVKKGRKKEKKGRLASVMDNSVGLVWAWWGRKAKMLRKPLVLWLFVEGSRVS